MRIGHQSVLAVEKMLRQVVCHIPHERFGIDHEPRLALRPQNVASVQIGREQHTIVWLGGKSRKCLEAVVHEQWVWPFLLGFTRLIAPVSNESRQRTKRFGWRLLPQSLQHRGDYRVLFCFGKRP